MAYNEKLRREKEERENNKKVMKIINSAIA
jgi:hypothetical protein